MVGTATLPPSATSSRAKRSPPGPMYVQPSMCACEMRSSLSASQTSAARATTRIATRAARPRSPASIALSSGSSCSADAARRSSAVENERGAGGNGPAPQMTVEPATAACVCASRRSKLSPSETIGME